MSSQNGKYYLGIFEGHADPAAALVKDGKVLAYSEEERHTRNKHAFGDYPIRALNYCLKRAGISISDVAAVGVNWDTRAYTDGQMASFYSRFNEKYHVDESTRAWQKNLLHRFSDSGLKNRHHQQWRKHYGDTTFPQIHSMPHHYVHAVQASLQSGFRESMCITIDGSGDQNCTVLWRHHGDKIQKIREIDIPNSLGWFYAAITEYLGFNAYDGEYKVMGLAAYGKPDQSIRKQLSQIVREAEDGIEYRVDPSYIHHGKHSYSRRFTDRLCELLDSPPRLPNEEPNKRHMAIAYEAQRLLEEHVERLVIWGVRETGIRNVCVGGGVGLNIKMNSRLFRHEEIDNVFAHPLCSDGGAAQGAALAACFELSQCRPERLRAVAYGYEATPDEIERILIRSKIKYEVAEDVCLVTAQELDAGKIVAWYQGCMEGGPRALGHRSILADPRDTKKRDKVNAIIKFREFWRPFCPSMTAEAAPKYFDRYQDAPFMIIAFDANERLRVDAPAIVHIDGTSRVQLVEKSIDPLYHRMINEFAGITGVPVVLNTSFNIRGEPIVCTPEDALRTFFGTGLEVLVMGNHIIRKTEE